MVAWMVTADEVTAANREHLSHDYYGFGASLVGQNRALPENVCRSKSPAFWPVLHRRRFHQNEKAAARFTPIAIPTVPRMMMASATSNTSLAVPALKAGASRIMALPSIVLTGNDAQCARGFFVDLLLG